MLARPSIVAALLMVTLLFGCGRGAEVALINPEKYRFHTCAQLEKEMTTLVRRVRELRALHDKAVRGAGGELVARVAYEPEYLTATGNIRLIEAAAREKNCNPPVTASAGASGTPAQR